MGSGIDVWLMSEFPEGCKEEDPLLIDDDLNGTELEEIEG
jgi:hypothetical protein